MSETPPLIARPASRASALIKTLIWGEAGSGKTRCALSFPAPLVLDLERGCEWYADEFSFWVAHPTAELPVTMLVKAVVDQVLAGAYPDRRTLVIDPITDYLDQLEVVLIAQLKQKGMDPDNLKGPKKAQAYAYIRDQIRQRLDTLLRLPMNIVFVARAKNVWGTDDQGRMAPVARTYDARDIVEFLCDVVLMAERGGGARVVKSRIALLPERLEVARYDALAQVLRGHDQAARERAAAPAAAAPAAAAPPPDEMAVLKPWLERLQQLEASGTLEELDALISELKAEMKKAPLAEGPRKALDKVVKATRTAIKARAAAPATPEQDFDDRPLQPGE